MVSGIAFNASVKSGILIRGLEDLPKIGGEFEEYYDG